MAKVLEFVGFDHDDSLAFNHVPGTAPTASCFLDSGAGAPPFGTRSVRIEPHKTDAFYAAGAKVDYTAATFALAAFYVGADPANSPTAANPIGSLMAVRDTTGSPYWFIHVDEDLKYEIYDSNGVHPDNLMSNAINYDATYRKYFMIWEPGTTPADGGDWAFYGGLPGGYALRGAGTALFGGSDAKADFTPGSSSLLAMYLGGQGGNQPVVSGDVDVYHGGCYLMDDVDETEFGLRLGNDPIGMAEGKFGDWQTVHHDDYAISKASISPDCDENGTAGGDDLDGGTTPDWADAGDENLATECTYDTLALPGGVAKYGAVAVAGPASRQLDDVRALSYTWYYKSAQIKGLYGLYDGSTYNIEDGAALIALRASAAAYRYDRRTWDLLDIVGVGQRMYNWQMVMGIGGVAGKLARTHRFAEGYMATLEAAPILTGKVTKGMTGNVTRGKRRWH